MEFVSCDPSNYRAGRTQPVRYIVMHYTANNGDTARNNCDYYHRVGGLQASAHYFVDEHGAMQSVREGDTAWHCGAEAGRRYWHPECRNANSIGIEMCSRKRADGSYYILPETVANAAALARNLDRLRRAASARIIGVVKGTGYGLGLTDYARFLTEHGVDMLAVSTAEEAAALRQAGIAAEVLMLSSTAVPRDVAVLLDCGAILTVGSCAAAETVSAVAVEKGVTARVHVKLDTGMGRFGFLPQDVTEAAALLKSLPSMRVEGVFTHFANTADEALTRRQYQQFQEGAALLERAGIETGLRHVCASSAFLRYPEMQLDAVRLGSALLGRLSVPDPLGLEKIGWLETQVMELKDLPSGWKVGYTGAYRTKRPTRLALLPAGYTSGVGVTEESNALRLRDRVYRLLRTGRALLRSNGLTGLVNGRRCPVRGVVGATQLALDVTDVPCAVGDTVRLEVRPKYVDSAVPREYR